MRDRLGPPGLAPWRAALTLGGVVGALLAAGCTTQARASDASNVAREPFVADAGDAGPRGSAPCTDGASCRQTVSFGGRKVDFYASRPLLAPNAAIERVVILVHGVGGDAAGNYVTLVKVADRAERAGLVARVLDTTLLVAPHFPVEAPEDHHSWGKQSWASGDRTEGDTPVSSYEIVDRLIVELTHAGRFPRLASITLAGHSAGGQLAHRYAATSLAEDDLPPHVHMRYVSANPGTYLYLRPERARYDRPGFAVPYRPDGRRAPGFGAAPSCPDRYDRYRFGLQRLNRYASRAGAERMIRNATSRELTYLVGSDDTIDLDCAAPDAPRRCRDKLARNVQDLDTSCPAVLQGRDRLARARHHAALMDRYFPGHRQRLIEVPGVHHATRAMFESDAGLQALFGR